MLSPRPDLDAALAQASPATSDVTADWLYHPPAGTHVLRRSVLLPPDSDLDACGRELLAWELHRRSGLRVRADGPVRTGGTVVLGARLGPLWAAAPCRVVEVVDEPDRVAFTYVTLPGHPEHGIEEFAFVRSAEGPTFEVRAVSAPAYWASRLAPSVARRVQAGFTTRYLAAARSIAAG